MRRELSDLISQSLTKLSKNYDKDMIQVIRDYTKAYTKVETKYFNKHTDDVRQLFLVQQSIALYSLELTKRLYRRKYNDNKEHT